MEDVELIEKYFRKELKPDELTEFNERLAADQEFKKKFEAETLLHKALQFSLERERIRSYALKPSTVAAPSWKWLGNNALITVGGTALAVWIFSTLASGVTSLAPENIKWVGLTVAVAGSMILFAVSNKTMNLRLATAGLLNGLLVFVTASGFDAINQGAKDIGGKQATEALLVPYTGNKAWWPTQSLVDSLDQNRKKLLEMGERIRTLFGSRLKGGPHLDFGTPGKFTTLVIPRSSTVQSGATYEAEIFLGTSPSRQSMEMLVNGNPIPLEADVSGVQKGKVAFTATADKFDANGVARKQFKAEIKVGDSTYMKVVEYLVVRPR